MGTLARLTRATKCKYCGANIAFIKTTAGKSMPVDPEPIRFIPSNDFKKFVMMDGSVQGGIRIYGEVAEEDLAAMDAQTGYVSHFSTCPKAEDARQHKNKSERKREHEQTYIDN